CASREANDGYYGNAMDYW
nr:immunoglobulin heavy chain junction region [Mus musculus]MBK4187182.1 immunoglobulin heavy chain junction region [Mus musculus]